MGLGQALGAGVAQYNANEAQREKEEMANREMENREAQTAQNISASKTNQKHTEMKMQELKQQQIIRANNQKKYNAHFNVGKPDENTTNATTILQEKVAKQEETIGDMQSLTINDTFGTNYFTDIKETNEFTDYKQLNNFVVSNELFKTTINDTLVKFNPNDPSHIKSLNAMLKQPKNDKENEQVEALKLNLIELAKSGQIAFGAKDGKAWDIAGMLNSTGIEKRISKSLIAGAKSTTEKNLIANMERQPKIEQPSKSADYDLKLEEQKEWKNADGTMENAEALLAWTKKVKLPIPPGLVEMVASNKEIKARNSDKKNQQERTQVMNKVRNRTASARDLDNATIIANGLESNERKNMMNVIEVGRDNITVDEAFKSDTLDRNQSEDLQRIESKNLRNNAETRVIKAKILADSKMTGELNVVLNKMVGFAKGEGIAEGWGAEHIIDMANKELNLVSEWAPGMTQGMLFSSIEMNTEIGKLVVDFVKATSGTAVTEEEYKRLQTIIAGAKQGDLSAMSRAMETYRDGVIRGLDVYNDNNAYFDEKDTMPYTIHGLKDIKAKGVKYHQQVVEAKTAKAKEKVEEKGMIDSFLGLFKSKEANETKPVEIEFGNMTEGFDAR